MKKIVYLPVLAILVLFSACYPIYNSQSTSEASSEEDKKMLFTESTRTQIEALSIDIKKIQFYNSVEIVLYRELSSPEAKVSNGKVEIKDGRMIEKIIIEQGTPGICEEVGDSYLLISFEEGKNLKFGLTDEGSIYYQIHADKWSNNYGKWKYGDKDYYILPSGANSRLMIQQKKLKEITEKTKTLDGRVIEE